MDADGFEVGIDTDHAEALTLRWIVVDGDGRLYALDTRCAARWRSELCSYA
jgi:hypothetical protein